MVRERGAAAQARSKRRRILAKFLAHVGSECVRCAMLLLGAVLDMTCAQKHSFETCALLFPTFFRSLPLSVREEMFGNGFHARIGAVILPASSSGCEWYSLRSFNMALAHGMALLLHCIALLLSTGLAQAAISSLSASYLLLLSLVLPPSLCSCVRCPHLVQRADALGAQGFGVLRDHAKRTDAFGAEDFVALRDRARRSDVLGAEGFAAL